MLFHKPGKSIVNRFWDLKQNIGNEMAHQNYSVMQSVAYSSVKQKRSCLMVFLHFDDAQAS
eukprot:6322991-Amphidinium_carterae.2